MRWYNNPSTDPFYNMSFDEWCLVHGPSDDVVFRLWRNRPSVIIGTSQNPYTEVNLPYLQEHGIELVRRSTGGGAVYHDLQNLNYSFAGPLSLLSDKRGSDHPLPVHMIADALCSFGVEAEVSGRNDIFVDGHKVSGYAKRVWRDRTLIHGTLMYDVDIDTLTHVLDTPESKLHRKGVASVRSRVANLKDLLPQFPSLDALEAALLQRFAASDPCMEFTPEQEEEVRTILEGRYARKDWILGSWNPTED